MSTPNSSSSSSPTDKNLPERKDHVGEAILEDEESKDDEDTIARRSRRKKPLFWDKIQTPPDPRVVYEIGRTPLRPKVIPKGYHFDVFSGLCPIICFRCGMWFDHIHIDCPNDEDSPKVVKCRNSYLHPIDRPPPGTITKLQSETQIISSTIAEEELHIEQSFENGLKNKEEETQIMRPTLAEEELTTDQSLENGLQFCILRTCIYF